MGNDTGFVNINSYDIEELQQFSISCFCDMGGLSSSFGSVTGHTDSFERGDVSLFHFKKVGDQFLLRTADGHHIHADLEDEWTTDEKVPEEEFRVTVEKDEEYPALVRLKCGDSYVIIDWIKSNFGAMAAADTKESATVFYFNTTMTEYGQTVEASDIPSNTTDEVTLIPWYIKNGEDGDSE